MTKRTKRYGGFLIGDKVRVKGKRYEWLKVGVVKALTDGYCSLYFKENSELLSEPVYYCFMPNQLINLTRIEEEDRKITDPLPPLPKCLVEEINKRAEAFNKIINFKPQQLPFKFDFSDSFGELRKWNTEDLLKKEHSNGALGTPPPKFKLNVKPNHPSPYTRDVYSYTVDFNNI